MALAKDTMYAELVNRMFCYKAAGVYLGAPTTLHEIFDSLQ